MFWGLKLEEGKNYSQLVDFSFHISHAALSLHPSPGSDSAFTSSLVAVHAVVEDIDYILCYLGKLPNSEIPVLQQPLNLEVSDGEEITLYMDSSNKQDAVYLTGYISGSCDTINESDESDLVLENAALSTPDEDKLPVSKKRKREEDCQRTNAGNGLETPPTKKKKNKHKKDIALKDVSLEDAHTDTKGKKKKVTVFSVGGTEVQDIVEGSGKLAKPGRKVFVKYTGRLAHNNRVFDSNIDGKRSFMFCLGKGEVIRGWDEGLKGMRVGGKRKLAIPPSQGYGSKGAPPKIPPNSKLLFDIELINCQ